MTLEQMLDDLPRECNVGAETNSKRYKESWIAFKFDIDAADGQIPISCIPTSASLNDSQAAIRLGRMTAERVTNLHDLSDSAYDAPQRYMSRSALRGACRSSISTRAATRN
jgi:hypothetical protein